MAKGYGALYGIVRIEMESFGAYLKKEREARKVSLEEICQATKIRRSILETIEGDRPEVLPPEVFVKGFIEAYARYIGLDPHEVLVKYREWKKGFPTEGADEPVRRWEKKVLKKYMIAGAVLLVIIPILLFLLHGQGHREGEGEVPITGANIEPEDISPSINLQTPSLAPSTEEPTPLPHGGMQRRQEPLPGRENVLVIEALERTWIEIKEGLYSPFDVTLYPGDKYTRRGPHRFELLIGNAGGVKVTFNGKELGSLGKVGQVVKVTLPLGEEE